MVSITYSRVVISMVAGIQTWQISWMLGQARHGKGNNLRVYLVTMNRGAVIQQLSMPEHQTQLRSIRRSELNRVRKEYKSSDKLI